jgi:hypothetical protein
MAELIIKEDVADSEIEKGSRLIYKPSLFKIGKLKVNVHSFFHSDKNLYDALFVIANERLKEKLN